MSNRQPAEVHLPLRLMVPWLIALPGLAACSVSGAMNAWALIHDGGAMAMWGAASYLVLLAWVLTTAVWLARRRAQHQPIAATAWWIFGPSAAVALGTIGWLATGLISSP
jgi:hypothetical protein